MDRAGLRQFLLDIDQQKIKDEGVWVMCTCPFSPYVSEHNFRQERNVSFGVSVHDKDISKYHCFTCHRAGTLVHLLETLGRLDGENYDSMIDELGTSEELGPPMGEWRENGKRKKIKEKVNPLDAEYEDLFDPCDPAHWYLEYRGLSPDTCERLQIKFDPNDKGVPRILFPVWDSDGGFYGYTGRAIYSDDDPKARDYFGLPKRHMLIGIHLHEQAEYICLTEGVVDYARGQDMGFPAVGVMFSGLTEFQCDILKKIGKPVYGFLDNDEAGRAGCLTCAKELLDHVPFMAVRWPKTIRERPGSDEPCAPGDVGQLWPEEMQLMIDTAQLYRA